MCTGAAMIACDTLRDRAGGHGLPDRRRVFEDPSLPSRQGQPHLREGGTQACERTPGVEGVVGEHDEIVDPAQVCGAATRYGVVSGREHGVREHRRGLGSDREARDPFGLETGEQVHEVVDRRVGAPHRAEPLLHRGRPDRRVAVADVCEQQRAARRGPPPCLEEEPGARRAPRLQSVRGTANGRDAVRDDCVDERCLDGPRHRGDGGRVGRRRPWVEDGEPPCTAGLLHGHETRPRRRIGVYHPLPSPGPGEGGPIDADTLYPQRPVRRNGPGGGSSPHPPGSPTYDADVLDERDLRIVAALQEDARATYADVGRSVGLSPSSVHERVRKLEQTGVIRAYRAVVDPEALGLYVTALIAVSPLDPRQPDDLPERVEEFPEVVDCFSVAGEANYILKVRTRTTEHLEDLIRRLREKGEVQTRTTVVLSIPFEGRVLSP